MPGPPRPRGGDAAAPSSGGGGAGGRQALARALASLISSEEEAARQGLCMRSDGYAKVDEALSVACMQEVVEAVAPGSAATLNTGGYGGPMSPELVAAVRELVLRTTSGSKPCFDMWEGDVRGDHQLWISCMGQPDAAPEERTAEQKASAASPDPAHGCGGGWMKGPTPGPTPAPVPPPRRIIDIRLREAGQTSASVPSSQRPSQTMAPAEPAVNEEGKEAESGDGDVGRWQKPGSDDAGDADPSAAGGLFFTRHWWEQAPAHKPVRKDAEGGGAACGPVKKDAEGGGAACRPVKKDAEGGGEDEEYLPAPILRLSKNFASLLRHRAADEGLCVRSDGFAKLDEVLSLGCMQRVLEHVAPESAGPLNTQGAGGPIDEALLGMVHEMVSTSLSKGRPRFELWEGGDADGSSDVWIRATHRHSLAHVTEVPPPETATSDRKEQQAEQTGKDCGHSVQEACARPAAERPPSHLSALLGDSRALAGRGGAGLEAAAPQAAAAAAPTAAPVASPAARPCVVPQRVMAPRVAPQQQATSTARLPASCPDSENAPPGGGSKCGQMTPTDTFREALRVLPADAPANVRAYLASLVAE
uniref:2'-phosphotransferase n=1 Tax=Alexandrium monilatum TaxID=311494 RepID=A0A7S4W8H7_9DINO